MLEKLPSIQRVLKLTKHHLQFAADNNFKFCCFFKNNKQGIIFHENPLLADSHEILYLIFFQKLGKMLQNLLSAAVMIGALRVINKSVLCFSELPDDILTQLFHTKHQRQMNIETALEKDLKTATKYYCSECGKWFLYKSKLEEHYVTHSEYRPYVCSKCGASFKRKQNWQIHCHNDRCLMKKE